MGFYIFALLCVIVLIYLVLKIMQYAFNRVGNGIRLISQNSQVSHIINIDYNNKVVKLKYGKTCYIILTGKSNNILLDKYQEDVSPQVHNYDL